MQVNQTQLNAINHFSGPALILAGPGSGKTLVITRRTQALIEEHGVRPENILVITFTRAAADEMRDRFMKLMGNNHANVTFGTFHAVFFKILKFAYNYRAENILREEERYEILRGISEGMELEPEDLKEFLGNIGSEISLIKGERIKLDNYYSSNCAAEEFRKIYKMYEERLRRTNRIDFDDMMVLCLELLTERQDILKLWQEKYKYVLVDEFQDINQIQYDIMKLLAAPQNNIFVVGDDDQSIYRFRGAKPEIMLNFRKDYADSKEMLLDKNYRSAEDITKAALRVVKNNNKRFTKAIKAVRSSGEAVVFREFPNQREENLMLVDEIKRSHSSGIPYREMAVLFRTNIGPRKLVEVMMEYNIPFLMKDLIPNIYEHWIMKNLEAYFRIAGGEMDRGLFLSIINRPKRYISRECFDSPQVSYSDMRSFYREKLYVVERIDKLEVDMAMLRALDPCAGIHYIRYAMEYQKFLEEYAVQHRIKVEELTEVLDELEDGARGFKSYADWRKYIDSYLAELKRRNEEKNKKDVDAVTIMTYHASKGLEYRIVYMPDCNEGIAPHRKAVMEEDMEEERRMFYVAMTRAKDSLHMYHAKERFGKPMECSRFIGEAMLDADELRAGVRIRHKMYGLGTIVSSAGRRLTVRFDNQKQIKILDRDYCIGERIVQLVEV